MALRVLAAVALAMNPTGDCSKGSGGRPGYHSPGGSTYLPDCSEPGRREYFRAFLAEGGGAYLIPRPDGSGAGPLEVGLCDSEDAELYAQYLCFAN